MLYAGAVAASPITTLASRPIADPRSPLSTGSGPGVGRLACCLTAITGLPREESFFERSFKE